MNRELKFRAWDRDNDEMIFDFGLTPEDFFPYKCPPDDCESPEDPANFSYWDNAEIMQYTGLKDKNGVELYEGDQIELTYWWFDGNEAESTLTGSVVYIPDRACFGIEGVKNEEWLQHIGDTPDSSDTLAFADINYNSEDMEIVGNIYENR